MRIKSYFAASVQAAIAMARREFGDGVTLVTSHVAAPDSRHLGEYEVVFAIDDENQTPVAPVKAPVAEPPQEVKAPRPSFTEFQQALIQAVAHQAPVEDSRAKLQQVRQLLAELGIEDAVVAALMTLVEQMSNAAQVPARCGEPEAAVQPKPAAPAEKAPAAVVTRPSKPTLPALPPAKLVGGRPGLSAAELAFISSVEDEPKKGADPGR